MCAIVMRNSPPRTEPEQTSCWHDCARRSRKRPHFSARCLRSGSWNAYDTQGYDCTVLAAIYHVVEHFAGHTFQIIYATKLCTGEDLGFYAHLSGAAAPDPLP